MVKKQQKKPGQRRKWTVMLGVTMVMIGFVCIRSMALEDLLSKYEINTIPNGSEAKTVALSPRVGNVFVCQPSDVSSVAIIEHATSEKIKNEENHFLSTLKELDGMGESLQALLDAAVLQRHQIKDIMIDPKTEEARCKRYGYKLDLGKPLRRRRVFWGSLIADDSWHILGIAAIEAHGIFHTAAFVESNTTQTMIPRSLRYPPGSIRSELLKSHLLWGNETRVDIDQYLEPPDQFYRKRSLWRENDQREYIIRRWKENGMTADDVGYISDIDEVATRDFLRALQICEVPQFASPNDCTKAKVSTMTIVFEGSPKCLQVPRRWNHPDFVIGECIDQIGDPISHPPVDRAQRHSANMRIPGWTKLFNYTTQVGGPLWDATDFRMEAEYQSYDRIMGSTYMFPKMLHTAYHFHNFFDSLVVMRRKYHTYGHPKKQALELSLVELQSNDLGFMVDCLTGRRTSGSKWQHRRSGQEWNMLDPDYGIPLAFKAAQNYAKLRHEELKEQLELDEKLHPAPNNRSAKL